MPQGRSKRFTRAGMAALSTDVLPMLEAEARQRQAHGQTAPGRTLPQFVAEAVEPGEARDTAGGVWT